MERGVCRHCRCTDDAACAGGCFWVDLRHTLCSRCAAMLIDELMHVVSALAPSLECVFVEARSPAEVIEAMREARSPAEVIEAMRESGMREATCSSCGLPYLTRSDDSICPRHVRGT